MENLYTQIAEDFKISEEFCVQYYMMKWNDWVRLKTIDGIKHGGKLNIIFSQNSSKKNNQTRYKKAMNLSSTKHLPKQNSTVGISPRSKLHASIDRIKRMSVPSDESGSLASWDRLHKLTTPQHETVTQSLESPPMPLATNSSSTSYIQSNFSVQHDAKSTFSQSHPHLICDLSLVKSEPEVTRDEWKTSYSISSNQFTNTINDISIMGLLCTNGLPMTKNHLYLPNACSKSSHYQSRLSATTADHFLFTQDSNVPKNHSNKPAESTYSSKSLKQEVTRAPSTENKTNTESRASLCVAVPDFKNELTTNPAVKAVTKATRSSEQHEIQQRQMRIK